MEVWENEKCCENTTQQANVSTAFTNNLWNVFCLSMSPPSKHSATSENINSLCLHHHYVKSLCLFCFFSLNSKPISVHIFFGLFSKTERLHIAKLLFCESQKMSRTSVTHSAIIYHVLLFVPHFDVICNQLLSRCTAIQNLLI